MKNRFKKIEKSILLILKLVLYVSLLMSFILILSIENKPLLKMSRTMGITMSTFSVVGILFMNAYGKFDIGRRKSKPIIYSLLLAAICTDVVTYIQLMIMNTITPSVSAFRLTSIGWLFLVVVVQYIIISIFTYGGNYLYFYLNDPEKCCIITRSNEDLQAIARGVMKYKKQYKIEYAVDYKRKDLLKIIDKVDTVILYEVPYEKRSEIINYCYDNRKNIYFNPEIADVVESYAEHYLIDDISMLNANVTSLSLEQRVMKRCMDLVLVLIFGVISIPIWLVSAIMIKSYDKGPILFKQKRATLNGKEFEVYKFRTMKEHVENRSVTKDDDRITPPGKILRKIRMDEIPQLLNILKGDMSFVGPRPEMLENVSSYTEILPEFKYRLRAKAGLTGYAQIAGKYNTSPKDKLILDMIYIENYSIFKDIQFLLQTAIVLLKTDSTEAFEEDDKMEIRLEDETAEKEEKID